MKATITTCRTFSFVVVCFIYGNVAFSQDSLQNYSVARWKVDRLIKIALKAKECDTLVKKQEKVIDDGARVEIKQDSVVRNQDQLIDNLKQQIAQKDSIAKDHLLMLGEEKRKKNNWKLGALGGGIIILLMLISGK